MEVSSICQGGQFSEQAPFILINGGSSQTQNTNIKEQAYAYEEVDKKEVIKTVAQLNDLLGGKKISLQYEIYGKSNNLVIRLVDNKTNEVIKELPPKKIIDVIDKLCEMAGVFMDKKA